MKPELTTAQRELIERTLQQIEATPELFDMTEWSKSHTCGTAGCFAWYCAAEATGRLPRRDRIGRDHVRDIAADALGLAFGRSFRLTNSHAWPWAFRQRYFEASTGAARASVLRDRVTHWLETGE